LRIPNLPHLVLEKHNKTYVSVLIPLAIPKVYDYSVPESLLNNVLFGVRVEVGLKNKLYSGLIIEIRKGEKPEYRVKDIISVLDTAPIIGQKQLDLWKWIASYYCCSLGEVMSVALPSGLKLSSESKIILAHDNTIPFEELDDDEFLIAEALELRNEIPLYDVQEILQKKTIYPTIRSLMSKGVAILKEELKQKYKAKLVPYLQLNEEYQDEKGLHAALDKASRSEKQTKALLAYISLKNKGADLKKKTIMTTADVSAAVIKSLIDKGIFRVEQREESRLKRKPNTIDEIPDLSNLQSEVLNTIKELEQKKKPILLHGITGSGKTLIYFKRIEEVIAAGGQVLYLLPEIGLTTQITHRMKDVFANSVEVFHSKISNNERVEIWRKVKKDLPIVLGARSSLFLPFNNLQLIIVDEEHDSSYKQSDPAPRYNARDTAIFLAHQYNASIILGSATPSLESFRNVDEKKYHKVELMERFGGIELPDIELVDLNKAYKQGRMKGMFSKELLEQILEVTERKKQVILFQNRRGYSPVLRCSVCDWYSECTNCDVKLTVHNRFNELRCHYCGKREKLPQYCPKCGSQDLNKLGFGTEKIEDELSSLLPELTIKRLDYDTAKTKSAFEKIITEFELGKIDVLVGTQMITKGLDFDNISLVGILNADKTINFPDFRAHERAFQLFTQVSGRAGRKNKKGKMIIQTFSPTHPVILETIDNNITRFITRELVERGRFKYPPYFRLIYIHLKHKKPEIVRDAAEIFAKELRKDLGNRVLGPTEPGVARVRGLYQRVITVKLEKDSKVIKKIKEIVLQKRALMKSSDGYKSVRVNIDVDPQ